MFHFHRPINLVAILVVVFATAFSCEGALAKHYGVYDLTKVIEKNDAPGAGGRVDMAYVDRVIQDLAEHAQNYPPRFDSPEDQQRAKRDITRLVGILDILVRGNASPSAEILLRLGLLTSLGHNLDIPRSAEFAQGYFTRLLALSPDLVSANYSYGKFLAETGRAKDAIPYLIKAKEDRFVPALYTLGMTYLTLGEKSIALDMLLAYQQARPRDESISQIIEAIRSGKVKIEQRSGK